MEEMLDQWMEEPIANLNLLNQIIPSLISTFNEKGEQKSSLKKVIGSIESIREVLDER